MDESDKTGRKVDLKDTELEDANGMYWNGQG